ncbi:MAG: multidrug transporter [Deltaproteobacteria bacterium]|nr:multidrug transporter [Deltaproteobacteria bacterium]
MKKHPILLGLTVFGVLLGLFLVSIWVLSYFSNREESFWGGEKIAIIEVRGVILDAQPVVEKLVKLRKNEKIKAIILREVKKAQKEKKVLVSMGSVAASGGYYIACAADRIIANPGSITGSIGVIVESLNVEELLGKLGLRSVVVKSGKHKDLGSPMRPMTGEDRKLLQGVIDSVHEQFIKAVAEGRKLPVEKVRRLADGRIFSGDQARSLGLVDELGNLEDTIAAAAQMAGIRGEPEVLYPEKKRFSLFDLLIQETMQKIMENLKESAPPLNFLYYWPFRG